MDHISDSFLETNVPLLVLIEAAKSGNEKEVKEYAQVFREHANKLVEVSQERPESWDFATGLVSPCGSWNFKRQPFYGFPGVIKSWNLPFLYFLRTPSLSKGAGYQPSLLSVSHTLNMMWNMSLNIAERLREAETEVEGTLQSPEFEG